MIQSASASRGVQLADSTSLSAFGRLRVANVYTIFDSKQVIDNQPLFWDDQQTAGAGTSSTYLPNLAASRLDVTANVAGTRVRQTFRRFNYQPGKGQAIFLTGALVFEGGAGLTGVTRRVGYFDDSNGVFFQRSGTVSSVVVRSFTSGSVVDTVATQPAWNLDRLDGTGPSQINLDTSKDQIFVVDFQWLGAGRVRFGFDIGGSIVYCHQVLTANIANVPFMTSPNMPLRYEISSAGTGPAATASLLAVCVCVNSDGGRENTGIAFAADRGAVNLATANDTNIYALLALRYKAAAANKFATMAQIEYSAMSYTANASFRMGLVLNPTVAAPALVYTSVPNSAFEVAVPAATNLITAGTGTIYSSFYDTQNHSGVLTVGPPTDLRIGSSIAGVSDVLVLFIQPVPAQGITNFIGAINWLEQV